MDYKEASSLLGRWDRILILTHKRPDGDTIGCAVALCALLRQVGKTAYILENEDATARFTPYLAHYLPPQGFAPDKVVAVDAASLGLLPESARPYADRGVDLVIDHHPSNEGYGTYNCVEADKAACGETLFKIVGELGQLTPEIAQALYLAVSTDTGCFVYPNTTANTHAVAAALLKVPFDYQAVNKRHFRTKSRTRLALEHTLLENARYFEEGQVAVTVLSLADIARLGASEEDAEDTAAVLGQVEGVRASATIREVAAGECKVSLRSDPGFVNCTAACALLGGGGHVTASGCTVYGTAEEAREAIRDAILKTLHG